MPRVGRSVTRLDSQWRGCEDALCEAAVVLLVRRERCRARGGVRMQRSIAGNRWGPRRNHHSIDHRGGGHARRRAVFDHAEPASRERHPLIDGCRVH